MQQDLPTNAFWTFCLKHYEQTDCRNCLLSLQDDHGLNVNFLLFMAFLTQQNIFLNKEQVFNVINDDLMLLSEIDAQREYRRCLKDGDATIYSNAKQEELELEKQHIEKLYAWYLTQHKLKAVASGEGGDNIDQYIVCYYHPQPVPGSLGEKLKLLKGIFNQQGM